LRIFRLLILLRELRIFIVTLKTFQQLVHGCGLWGIWVH